MSDETTHVVYGTDLSIRKIPAKSFAALSLIALWLGIAVMAGCAAHNSRGDIPGGANAAAGQLSPEQCAAGAAVTRAAEADGSYVIQPGDELLINFYLNSEFDDTQIVRPDGKIALRLVGPVLAAGLTPQRLGQRLDELYSSELKSPGASVQVKNMPSRQVFVQGQVSKPGAFPLEPGMSAVQAIAVAGGVTETAGSKAVLIRRDVCGVPSASKIDLASAEGSTGVGDDVALQPRDVIVVPRSGIANLDLWVQQYIRGVLPIQPYATTALPPL
jgi:protein involved in polysaccharide export with SLBB domain